MSYLSVEMQRVLPAPLVFSARRRRLAAPKPALAS
jgi:hypothetical protein